MNRSVKAYDFVRAAIRAREQQEVVLKLMQAVTRLGELATAEAAKANRAAAESLGDYGTTPHFVVVDGQQYVVNRYGITRVNVEELR